MDVSHVSFTPARFILTLPCADHTKYVGKSSSHTVSSQIFMFLLEASDGVGQLQENLKFSEDGETVIEGEEKDVD